MAFRSIGTNQVAATNLVVPAPSGIVDGDILVAVTVNDATTGVTTWPSGFVEGPASPQTMSSFDTSVFRYAIKVASSESGDYTLTGANQIIGCVACFSGRVQSTTPHRDSGTKSDVGNASPYTITSAAFSSATSAPADILWIASADGTGSDQTFTAPSGYTKDCDLSGTVDNSRQFALAHKDGVAAGETGALAGSGAGASAAWSVFAIALAAPATCALTGTATAGITEADIVAGGKTIIATLTNETYLPASGFENLTFVGDAKNAGLGNADLTVDLSGISMQQGDLVLVAYGVVNTADHPMSVTTAGYTELFEDYADDSRDANGAVAYKIMGATPDTSVVLANPGALSTNSFVACVQVWRGVDQATPIDATTTEAEGTNSSVSNSPSITTVTDNALVVSVGVNTGAAADVAVTSPAGYTNQTEHSTDPGTSIRVMMASKIVASHGAEDPAAWGGITTTTSDSWLGFTVALRPAATTPFADAVAAFIAGLDSAQSEATGWDAVVKAGLTSANVARTSDTIATVTLPAFGTYNITAQETITDTIPGSILTGGNAIVATPTFTIDPAGGPTPITFNATPVTRSWSLPAAVVLAAASLTATPAIRSWTVPTISIAAARSIAATPSTRSWSVPNALLAAGGVTLGATPVSRTWNVPITALSAARSIAATPSVQTWTVPASTLFVSGGSITFNASAVSRSWSVPAVTLAADRTFAATPAIHTWTNPSSTIATARTLVAPAAFKAWIVPSPALLVEPPIAFDATPAVSTWVVPGGTVSGITVTFAFRITGGPVMTAFIDGGRVLAASVAGGPVLMGTMSGGPV